MQSWKIVRSEGKNILGHTIINKPRLFFKPSIDAQWVEVENLLGVEITNGLLLQFSIDAEQLIVEWLPQEVTESAV